LFRLCCRVGNARSGTTWTHNLLLLNDDFTALKTWEIFFGASVTWRHLFVGLYNFDRNRLHGFFFNIWMGLEAKLAGNCKLHPIGLFCYEEDEFLMVHIFICQLVLFVYPEGGALLYPMVRFDEFSSEMVPSSVRRSVIAYYRDCVKRHLFFHCRARDRQLQFVSKNPPFTMRLETLLKEFPDARFACLVRDPKQSVPSMVSYISHVRPNIGY
jgi:hypothetical protein